MMQRIPTAAGIRLAIITMTLVAMTIGAPVARASEDAIRCVKELALPGYRGVVVNAIPAMVRVDILIGSGGRAKKVTYNSPVAGFKTELDDYFAKKTTYAAACQGRTITFFVSYKLQEDPAAITEVRFAPPDQILVIGHRPVVAFDPPGPNYEIKKK